MYCFMLTLLKYIRESNAIVLYLVEKYDPLRKISIASENFEEKMTEQQWLFFQASGQGYVPPSTFSFGV